MNGSSPSTLVIATAGHIDHGKTTLVRALTGIETDRLPEEKRRGITIDLGYASFQLERPDRSPLCISFVDVPGHSLFVRNMLAGAGCVPAVLLVVAADEGIKPQTIEHLAICELLGIRRGLIVLTKCDAASNEQQDQVADNVHALVEESFLRNAPVLAVSARTGEGLSALRDELVKLALNLHAAASDGILRLPIDRAFVMKGFGTVVTGTLLSGSIREGQSLALEPGGRSVRVRGLQTHGQPEQTVHAGTRVAVNLSGIDVSEVHRGQTLIGPDTLSAADMIDVEMRLLASAPPLKHATRVHFHAFTSEVMGGISLYGYDAARPSETRLARVRLDHPIVLAPGDHFVLRQPAPVATIGGGRVLDCYPKARQRKAETSAWLEQIRNASIPEQLALRIQRRGTAGISTIALAGECGLTTEMINRDLQSTAGAREIALISGSQFVSRQALVSATNQVMTVLDKLAPKSAAIKSSELRNQTSLPPAIFDYVMADLVRAGKLRMEGEVVSLASSPAASSRESAHLAAIGEAYEVAGLAAPLVPELAQRLCVTEADMRRYITLLQRQKTLVRMGSDDLFMHTRAIGGLISQMESLRGKLIDVGRFKQLTGLSRKYAIPLLEYLDHARITRKQGDKRLVL